MAITLLVGSDKGGFIYRANADRSSWTLEGPSFKGWKVTATTRTNSGRFLAATASQVYGPAVHVSDDLKTWRQLEQGPAWAEGIKDRKLNQIWTFRQGGDRIWAGVDEAGLFTSDNDGESWSAVDGLNEHPTRSSWFPGAGGLCAHAILVDPRNADRVWCGISAVGVFRTEDGGHTWQTKNAGIKRVIEDKDNDDVGYCVHGLAADPDDANVIYRREHVGMYRSRDGGDSWETIEEGLASWFGFPIVMDDHTKTLFCVPLESDENRMPSGGRLEVYRSRDGGDHWTSASQGLPIDHYGGVLRGAMDVDEQSPCGVYFGTTAGEVWASADGADRWHRLPGTLPRVLSIQAYEDI